MASTPWAVLLFKFNDDASDPWPRQRYEEIFTTAGNGQFNMVDFFSDISHGHLDLSGSKVLGWYTLDKASSDYKGSGATAEGMKARNDLLTWVLNAKADAQDTTDLTGFKLLIVSNVVGDNGDEFGSGAFAALSAGRTPVGKTGEGMVSFSPSIAGQEMGHGYGLNHSRLDGTSEDYTDPYDIMSTRTDFMAPHPVYTERDARGNPVFRIGPGLNAANMWAMNWLDLSRTWTGGGFDGPAGTVVLRPLHRRDLPGYLCAKVGEFFVEFRMNELWDAGLNAPAVLVHSFSGGQSYIHKAQSGALTFSAGDFLAQGYVADPPTVDHGPGMKISVLEINAAERSATVEVGVWHRTRREAGPAELLGAVASDGGGWIIVGGKVVRIPPRSPLLTLLESLADAAQGDAIRHGIGRSLALEEAYETVARLASAKASEIRAFKSPTMPAANQLSARPPGE
jgi:hypothetical protein